MREKNLVGYKQYTIKQNMCSYQYIYIYIYIYMYVCMYVHTYVHMCCSGVKLIDKRKHNGKFVFD